MKKLLIVLTTLAIIAGVGVMKAEAAPTDTIAVTVTLQNISVAVSPDAWAIGTVAPSSVNTLDCTATNDGNINENLDIAVSNSADWTASAGVGANTFVMDYRLTATDPWFNIPNLGIDLKNNLAPGAQIFTLRFTAPSSSTVYTQQSITVTVSATAA